MFGWISLLFVNSSLSLPVTLSLVRTKFSVIHDVRIIEPVSGIKGQIYFEVVRDISPLEKNCWPDYGQRTNTKDNEFEQCFPSSRRLTSSKRSWPRRTSGRGRKLCPLGEARGRVLAEDVAADRDYPPFHRSIRDGFAVRAEDVAAPPVELRSRGEIRAGGHFSGTHGGG